MLVIATSVPDEREWIQWKGRTARQDRPGQYHVVLNTRAKPFEGNKELLKKVRSAAIKEGELKGQPDHELRVELIDIKPIYPSLFRSILSILFIYLSIYLSIYPSIHPSIHHPSIHLSLSIPI